MCTVFRGARNTRTSSKTQSAALNWTENWHFLPSYFFEPPTDASKTDPLSVSVVVKGTASLVIDNYETAAALNAPIEKKSDRGRI